MCAASAALLADAGWHCVTLDDPAAVQDTVVASASRQACERDLDLLLVGIGASVTTPAILAEVGKGHSAEVATEVVVALADPLDVLWHHWTNTVANGFVTPLNRTLDDVMCRPETLPDLVPIASLAPLIAAERIRLHTVAMAHLQVPILNHIFRDVLNVCRSMEAAANTQVSQDVYANATIALSDARRLISTVLFRDAGVTDTKARAAAVAEIPDMSISSLARLMAEKSGIARRDVALCLPNELVDGQSALFSKLAGRWTMRDIAESDLSRGQADLSFYDADAGLSVKEVADAANELAGQVHGVVLDADQSSRPSQPSGARTAIKSDAVTPTKDQPRLLVLGHSHIGAFDLAWKAQGPENLGLAYRSAHLNAPRFQPNFEQAKGGRRVAPGFRAALHDLLQTEKPDLIVALPMGNEYNAVAMTRVGPLFEFFAPGDTTQPTPGVCQIPYAMMRDQIATLARRNALLILSMISEIADCEVISLPPPPPIFDEDHIRAHPGRFAQAVSESGLNPADLRSRLWTLYVDVLADALAAIDTELFELPDAVFDYHAGQPFLAAPMRAQDPTHANASYGAIVLAALATRLVPARADAA